ncbi:MAG: hypothetical protein AAB551_01230 [Patescibacteria group bacterium]
MKKKILEFLLIAAVLSIVLHAMAVFAQSSGPFHLPDSTSYGTIPGAPDKNGDTALQKLATLVGGYRGGDGGLIGVARPIIMAISILMIIISGFRILFADGEEGKIDSAKSGIMYGVLGLGLISIASEVTKVFSLSDDAVKAIYQSDGLVCYKTILSDPNAIQCRAKLFSKTVQIIITFLKYIVGAIAVAQVIVSAFRLATLGSQPESFDMDKKKLIWGVVGFIMIIVSDRVVTKVFYNLNFDTYTGVDGVKPILNPAQGVAEIVGFTNYVISFVGPLAVLSLIGGGIMYMTNNGDEGKIEQAKRIILFSVIGILVIYGAFGLVSTVIAGKFS